MKKQKSRRKGSGRWAERTPSVKLASPYPHESAPSREPRRVDHAAGERFYESSYDIRRGYTHDRSITIL
jgi:hypothetical protein